MPGVSGVTVVTNACAYYHCARGCGRAERPAFPAPSIRRAGLPGKTRARNARRDRGVARLRYESVAHPGRHHPRKRMIQYSVALMIAPRSHSVLDTPLARGMTACCGAAPRITGFARPAHVEFNSFPPPKRKAPPGGETGRGLQVGRRCSVRTIHFRCQTYSIT
jgi:hypothetical protein